MSMLPMTVELKGKSKVVTSLQAYSTCYSQVRSSRYP